ncbi:hypothetical protein [Actinoplanes sp. NPDC026619]|uniref:hypothetical protein n=1 Tax=Actinoplanes sp. NPDC026619 TaxID=3155798 RepID=UPI0033F304BD
MADYLRARDLTLSGTRTGVTLRGTQPEKAAIAISGIFGVDQINTLGMTGQSPCKPGIAGEDGDAKDRQKKDPEDRRKIDQKRSAVTP